MVSRLRASKLCSKITYTLTVCLPFFLLFDSSRNIDAQGLLLLVLGGFAWTALLLNRDWLNKISRLEKGLIAIFMISCMLSAALAPHKSYGLLGAPHLRLGALGLIGCVGAGALMRNLTRRQFVHYIYVCILVISLVSVPFSASKFHSLGRIGGVFAQADIMACFVGCGLLLGFEILKLYPAKRNVILGSQFLLLALLILTETRSVIILVAILALLWSLQQKTITIRRATMYCLTFVILLSLMHTLLPNRLTDTAYASASTTYRLSLQSYALHASTTQPLWGYGPGNLADALACPKLVSPALITTCKQGYFFNSSHNIFIDRVLALGWLGGLSYLLLVALAIYRALRSEQDKIFGFALVLITGYYFTNVTSLTLELLVWLLIMRCLMQGRPGTSHASA